MLRAGAKSTKRGASKSSSSSKKKRVIDDDEDDDDVEEEDDDLPSKKSGRKAKKSVSSKYNKKSQSSKFQLIPWGKADSKGKKKRKGLSIREKLEQIAKQGQSAYKEVYRRAKVLKSSAFEGMLLKATWPGNDPVPADILSEIIKYSIPAFKYSRAVSFQY